MTAYTIWHRHNQTLESICGHGEIVLETDEGEEVPLPHVHWEKPSPGAEVARAILADYCIEGFSSFEPQDIESFAKVLGDPYALAFDDSLVVDKADIDEWLAQQWRVIAYRRKRRDRNKSLMGWLIFLALIGGCLYLQSNAPPPRPMTDEEELRYWRGEARDARMEDTWRGY